MTREEVLSEIIVLLIAKRNYTVLLNKMTAEIDEKARQIELKSSERTKLILQAEEIMNHPEGVFSAKR